MRERVPYLPPVKEEGTTMVLMVVIGLKNS